MFDTIFKYVFGSAFLCAALAEQTLRSGESEHVIVEDPNNLGYSLEPKVVVPDYVPDDIFSL